MVRVMGTDDLDLVQSQLLITGLDILGLQSAWDAQQGDYREQREKMEPVHRLLPGTTERGLRPASTELALFQTIRLLICRPPVPLPGDRENLLEFFPFRLGHVARFPPQRNGALNAVELIGSLAGAGGAKELNVFQVVVLDHCGSGPKLPKSDRCYDQHDSAAEREQEVSQSSRFQIKSPLLRLERAAQVG